MVSSRRNDGTITQELRYPFAGTAVQFLQESSLNLRGLGMLTALSNITITSIDCVIARLRMGRYDSCIPVSVSPVFFLDAMSLYKNEQLFVNIFQNEFSQNKSEDVFSPSQSAIFLRISVSESSPRRLFPGCHNILFTPLYPSCFSRRAFAYSSRSS